MGRSCKMALVKRADVESYLRRDWAGAAERKAAFWAERKARLTPLEALRLGDDLRRQVCSLRPGWPSAEERLEDLAVHLKVSELLRRAGPLPD